MRPHQWSRPDADAVRAAFACSKAVQALRSSAYSSSICSHRSAIASNSVVLAFFAHLVSTPAASCRAYRHGQARYTESRRSTRASCDVGRIAEHRYFTIQQHVYSRAATFTASYIVNAGINSTEGRVRTRYQRSSQFAEGCKPAIRAGPQQCGLKYRS